MDLQLQPDERIQFKRGCNLVRVIENVGGKLYITNNRIYFHPHRLNIQKQDLEVFYSDIERAELEKKLYSLSNGMKLVLKDGTEHKMAFWRQKEVIAYVNAML